MLMVHRTFLGMIGEEKIKNPSLISMQSGDILGDPGADKGGEGKSKRAEKYIWNEEK